MKYIQSFVMLNCLMITAGMFGAQRSLSITIDDVSGSIIMLPSSMSLPGQISSSVNSQDAEYPEFDQDGNLSGSAATSPATSPRSLLEGSFVDVLPSGNSQTVSSSSSSSPSSSISAAPCSYLTPAERHKRSQFISALKKEVLPEAERAQINQHNPEILAGEYTKFLEAFADKMAEATQEYDRAMHELGLHYFIPHSWQPTCVSMKCLTATTVLSLQCALPSQPSNNASIRWAASKIDQDYTKVIDCALRTFSVPPTFIEALQAVSPAKKATIGLSAAAMIIIPVAYLIQKAVRRPTT